MGQWLHRVLRAVNGQWAVLNGALLFYTRLPLPSQWPVQFDRIAWVVPVIGLGLGGMLVLLDLLLGMVMPLLLRSALVVLIGVWLTGGLHLDGAMDTADGLAVQDDQRRLAVMADSQAGAFGVMAAIAILMLKVTALAAIAQNRWFVIVSAVAWGRWGQQWAIASYPYLKPEGKGAFHKQAMPSRWYALPCALGLMGCTLGLMALGYVPWLAGGTAMVSALVSAWLVATWLNHRLGGHTGDTYGAVVEWVETAVMVGLASVY